MKTLLNILKYILIMIIVLIIIISIATMLGINTYDKFGYKVLELIVKIVGE
jgi:type IV secretory pathway component VirB8